MDLVLTFALLAIPVVLIFIISYALGFRDAKRQCMQELKLQRRHLEESWTP